MAHPLDGSRLQVARAKQHFDALKAEVDLWLDENPYPVSEEDDPETGDKVVRVGDELPVPPPGWAVIVNDLGNNCRSALEYVIAELSVKFGGDPKRDKVSFPITTDRDGYWKPQGRQKRSYRDTALKGIPDEWRKRVDAVQPYRHHSPALRARDPLTLLNWVNNANKHRELHPGFGSIYAAGYMISPGGSHTDIRGVVIRISGPDQFSIEAQVRTSSLRADTLMRLQEVKVKPSAPVEMTFGDRRVSMAELKRIVSWSEAIVKFFEPAFEA